MNCFPGIGVVMSCIASLDLHNTTLFVAGVNDNERTFRETTEKDVRAQHVRPPDNPGQVIIQPGGRALHTKERADCFAEVWSDGDGVSGVALVAPGYHAPRGWLTSLASMLVSEKKGAGNLLVTPYAIRRPITFVSPELGLTAVIMAQREIDSIPQ
jgi:hypothetical protein